MCKFRSRPVKLPLAHFPPFLVAECTVEPDYVQVLEKENHVQVLRDKKISIEGRPVSWPRFDVDTKSEFHPNPSGVFSRPW
jgi:hypothetical protein